MIKPDEPQYEPTCLGEAVIWATDSLFRIERVGDANVIIWSSGAVEQIEAVIADWQSREGK